MYIMYFDCIQISLPIPSLVPLSSGSQVVLLLCLFLLLNVFCIVRDSMSYFVEHDPFT